MPCSTVQHCTGPWACIAACSGGTGTQFGSDVSLLLWHYAQFLNLFASQEILHRGTKYDIAVLTDRVDKCNNLSSLEISGNLWLSGAVRVSTSARPHAVRCFEGQNGRRFEGKLQVAHRQKVLLWLACQRFGFAVSFLLKWFQTLYVVVLCKLHRRSANSCHGVALQECVATPWEGHGSRLELFESTSLSSKAKYEDWVHAVPKWSFSSAVSSNIKQQSDVTCDWWLRFCHHYMLPHTSWLPEWPNVREWHMRRSSTRRLGHSGMKSMAFRAWGFVCPETSVAHGWKPSSKETI